MGPLKHNVTLQKPGWKVELAKKVKQQLLEDGPTSIAKDVLGRWAKLFETIDNVRPKSRQAVAAP
jgi:hypothetical protein